MCNSTLSNACGECISDSLCISCIDNFTLKEGKCVCQPLFYAHAAATCLQYPTQCLQYSPQVGCTRCENLSTDKGPKYSGGSGDSIMASETQEPELFGAYEPIKRLLQGTVGASTCNLCQLIIGCVACTIDRCIQCDTTLGFTLSNTKCKCNVDRFLNTMSVCQKCSQDGCLTCISQEICTSCTPIYHLSNVVCIQTCGDGIRLTLECDDGNLQNGDGCSSTCNIQLNFNCVGGSKTSKSACSYSGSLQLRVVKFQKQPFKNQFVAQFQISPNLPFLNRLNFAQAIQTNFLYQNMTVTYSNTTGIVQIRFQYNQSLNSQQGLKINFNFPKTPQFLFTPTASYMLPSTTDNNLPLQYYDISIYESIPAIQTLAMVLTILSLGLFFFLFVIASKLMAVQFIAVFQLAYIGLMMITRLEPLLTPLTGLWIVNGYNGIIQGYPNIDLPHRISAIGYKSFFLENFNLMILMLLLPLLVGTVLLIYSRVLLRKKTQEQQSHSIHNPLIEAELLSEHSQGYRNNLIQIQIRQLHEIQEIQEIPQIQQIQQIQEIQQIQNPSIKLKIIDQIPISQKDGEKNSPYAPQQQPYKRHRRWAYLCYKEYELSSFLFISYQVLVSLGIAFLYGLDQLIGIILGIIVMLGLIAMTILFYFRPANFGEYKTFFTETALSKNFYIVIIVLRVCIGLSISLPTNPTISVCLTLSFCVVYFLLLVLMRPYKSNLRPIVNSIFTVIIFIIYTLYGLNLLQRSQLTTTYLPILVICVLFLCIVFNLCYIIWYIYRICKEKQSEEQLNKEIDKTRVILNQLRGETLDQPCNSNLIMAPFASQSSHRCIQIMKQINKPQNELIDPSIQQVNQLYDAI